MGSALSPSWVTGTQHPQARDQIGSSQKNGDSRFHFECKLNIFQQIRREFSWKWWKHSQHGLQGRNYFRRSRSNIVQNTSFYRLQIVQEIKLWEERQVLSPKWSGRGNNQQLTVTVPCKIFINMTVVIIMHIMGLFSQRGFDGLMLTQWKVMLLYQNECSSAGSCEA